MTGESNVLTLRLLQFQLQLQLLGSLLSIFTCFSVISYFRGTEVLLFSILSTPYCLQAGTRKSRRIDLEMKQQGWPYVLTMFRQLGMVAINPRSHPSKYELLDIDSLGHLLTMLAASFLYPKGPRQRSLRDTCKLISNPRLFDRLTYFQWEARSTVVHQLAISHQKNWIPPVRLNVDSG